MTKRRKKKEGREIEGREKKISLIGDLNPHWNMLVVA
jgi:hypothetical protein